MIHKHSSTMGIQSMLIASHVLKTFLSSVITVAINKYID
jgi:hypothetical protein